MKLLIAVFTVLIIVASSTALNMANADSFPFYPVLPSPIQSNLEPYMQDQNGFKITTNSDKLRLIDQPFPLLLLFPLHSQSQQALQQDNQPMHQQPSSANLLNSHNNYKLDNHSPSVISELPF